MNGSEELTPRYCPVCQPIIAGKHRFDCPERPTAPPVVDLLAALQRSVDKAKAEQRSRDGARDV